jgi:dephospho-CoA kinase
VLVGLTGGIGSGKSTVAALLRGRGAVVVDADQTAREMQAPGTPLVAAMAARFGDHIVGPDGALDRAAVAALVFGDSPAAKANLADLNAITHPAIQAEIETRVAAHAHTASIVVLDHPLLGEQQLGEHPRTDLAELVVVDVDPEVAVRRLVEYRGMPEDDARRRIASQLTRERRRSVATFVIDNSGDRGSLERQVDELWSRLSDRVS